LAHQQISQRPAQGLLHTEHGVDLTVLLVDRRKKESERVSHLDFRLNHRAIDGKTQTVEIDIKRPADFRSETFYQAEHVVMLKQMMDEKRSRHFQSPAFNRGCLLVVEIWEMPDVHSIFTELLDVSANLPAVRETKRQPSRVAVFRHLGNVPG